MTQSYEFQIENGKLTLFLGKPQNWTIRSGGRTIHEMTTYSTAGIRTVVIPSCVREIAPYSVKGEDIETVIVQETKILNHSCFANCPQLKNLFLPDSVQYVSPHIAENALTIHMNYVSGSWKQFKSLSKMHRFPEDVPNRGLLEVLSFAQRGKHKVELAVNQPLQDQEFTGCLINDLSISIGCNQDARHVFQASTIERVFIEEGVDYINPAFFDSTNPLFLESGIKHIEVDPNNCSNNCRYFSHDGVLYERRPGGENALVRYPAGERKGYSPYRRISRSLQTERLPVPHWKRSGFPLGLRSRAPMFFLIASLLFIAQKRVTLNVSVDQTALCRPR